MILLISEDLMMSSTVSAAVREHEGTFRFVKSIQRAQVKLEGLDCQLLLVDLQAGELDWDALPELLASVPRAIAYAQHVNVDVLRRGSGLGFEKVLTRGQFFAGAAEIVATVFE